MGCGSSKGEAPSVAVSAREGARFEYGRELGVGASCKVHKVYDTERKMNYAIKNMSKSEPGNQRLWEAEIALLKILNDPEPHPNILEYVESGEDAENYYVLTTLAEGKELFDRISECEYAFTEKIAAYYSKMLIAGVAHCHSKNIAHRDLKPENCIFDSLAKDSVMRVIDFGCAVQAKDNDMIEGTCGSEYYIAPESIPRKRPDPPRSGKVWKASDMWSVGIIIYIACTGEPPFCKTKNRSIYENIIRGKFKYPPDHKLSNSVQDLIAKLLTKDVEARLTAEEALQHPWIQGETASEEEIGATMQQSLANFRSECRLRKAVGRALRNQMSELEKKEVELLFKRFDKNGDGKLSANEIAEMMRHLGKGKEDAEALINEADEDGDGGLSMEELMTIRSTQHLGEENVSQLKDIFDQIDTSGDGLIDATELQALCHITKEHAQELIDEADDSSDGRIDFQEWLSVMGKINNR